MKTFQTIKALLLAALLVPLLALGQGGVVPPSFIKCSITTQNLVAAGVATAGSACEIRGPLGTTTGQVTGTYTAAGGLTVQETVDGLVWKTLAATTTVTRGTTGVQSATITSAEQDTYTFNGVTGKARMRVTALGAVTGTAVVSLNNVPFGGGSGGGSSGGGGAVTNAGTFAVQAAQSGTWTVQPGNTANTTAWKVDGSAVTQPVSSATLATAANQATELTSLTTINASINTATTQLPVVGVGSQAAAASFPVTASTEDVARIGGITETAPANDTAPSGLNGRSQRVAQNITTMAAKIPTPDTTINTSTATSRTPVTMPDSLALTGTCTSACTNVVLFTQEMTGYDGASIQLTSAGVGATIQYQISEDNTTYSTLFCRVNNAVGSQSGSTRTAVGIDWCPRKAKWLRVQITGYSSGTVTVVGTAIKTSAGFGDIGINNTSVGIAGQAAHDAAINGAPVRTGGAAYTANPTAVATGDTANFITTLVGAQIIYPWSIPDLTWQYASAADVTDTTSTEMKAAVASTRQYITSCQFSNTDATVGTYVNLLSAAAVIGVVYVAPQTAATAGQNSLAVTFTPPLRGSNVNEAMNFQAVTTSAQLRVACQGFASTH